MVNLVWLQLFAVIWTHGVDIFRAPNVEVASLVVQPVNATSIDHQPTHVYAQVIDAPLHTWLNALIVPSQLAISAPNRPLSPKSAVWVVVLWQPLNNATESQFRSAQITW